MKQIVLIDGKWLAYRMHFSHLNLRAENGMPTGMLHGFPFDLLRLNRKLPEAHIIICWDGQKRTWRHGVLPGYKGNRGKNPEHAKMMSQIALLIPFLRKLGLWVLELPEVEADDMIGMAAKLFSKKGYEVRIYSKDRDMFQLVDSRVWMWPDMNMPPLRQVDIARWLGAPLSAFLDIRAMAGDSGDNLKGLPGVGMKIAVKLWNEGLRVTDLFPSNKHYKYRKEWVRLNAERKVARIITSPNDKVWSKETSWKLNVLLDNVMDRPGQDKRQAMKNRREVYQFLSEFDLKELLAERHKLFQLP